MNNFGIPRGFYIPPEALSCLAAPADGAPGEADKIPFVDTPARSSPERFGGHGEFVPLAAGRSPRKNLWKKRRSDVDNQFTSALGAGILTG